MQWFFEECFEFAIRGMNLDAPSDYALNGERALVNRLAMAARGATTPWTVFDVGANVGHWSAMTSGVLSRAGIDHAIWAFEPGHDAYRQLVEQAASIPAIHPQRLALGSEEREATLHYDTSGSGLASLYDRRGVKLSEAESVSVTTLDRFREQCGIGRIHVLKLDVEGHEVAVLRGAVETLESGAVEAVQFEFGGTHIDSRTFMCDVYDALGEAFEIYRVLRDGLRPLGEWSENLEIFHLGNYVALRRDHP